MEHALILCGSTVANPGRATVSDVSDSGVVKRILGGDRDAFRTLVDRYERPVFTLCLRMLKNRHDAEDCAQTAFIKAYSALASFRAGSSFKSWIYRIASNVCIDVLRRRARILERKRRGRSCRKPLRQRCSRSMICTVCRWYFSISKDLSAAKYRQYSDYGWER